MNKIEYLIYENNIEKLMEYIHNLKNYNEIIIYTRIKNIEEFNCFEKKLRESDILKFFKKIEIKNDIKIKIGNDNILYSSILEVQPYS